MSSATSTDPSTRTSQQLRTDLRPWQFFVLAGMLSAAAVVIVATGQPPASIITLSLTVVAASLVALGAYRALLPLVLPDQVEPLALTAGGARAALEREKTLVLRSIKELEFDFAMGKITQSDFEEIGGRLRARAIGLMKQLDAGSGYRSAIEQELQIRIAGKTANLKPRATEPPNEAIADNESVARDFLTAEASAKAVSPAMSDEAMCPSCGGSNDADARFCKHCGTKLSAA